MVEPTDFRFNDETSETNRFQNPTKDEGIAQRALAQHRCLRDLLTSNGVTVTLAQADEATPDAPFCNNWFSTHPAMHGLRDAHGSIEEDVPPTLVLYPLLAPNRRRERSASLVEGLFRRMYPRIFNMAFHEKSGRFLESTGSLCMHDSARMVYAAISPRTDRELASAWAERMGYRLVAFHARDARGIAYYHTNVMMFIGHGLAGVCLESIDDTDLPCVQDALASSDLEVMGISRDQAANFCGNALSLTNARGEPLLVMSTRAWESFDPDQQRLMSRHCKVLHTDLSVFEEIGGGSARCLIGELF